MALQGSVAPGLQVEQVEREVQGELEAKVEMVGLLVIVMLRREYGQHTRTGMIESIVNGIVDVTKKLSLTPVPILLLVLLGNV